jgi:hypothetical protein
VKKEQVSSSPPTQLTGYTWEKEMNQNFDISLLMYEALIIIV